MFRFFNFFQAFFFTPFEPANTGNFLKNDTPFLRFAVKNPVNSVLPDNGHGVLSYAGIGKKMMNIF